MKKAIDFEKKYYICHIALVTLFTYNMTKRAV